MTLLLACDDEGLAEAARLLREGRLVAFPTETVYGLGGDATSSAAVAGIYSAKGRPRFNPLIAHVADLASAGRLARFSPRARALAEQFWPGPLTLVLPLKEGAGLSDLVTAGLSSVAIRIPAHPVALTLLRRADRPVAAPSANRSGHVSPTTAAHVLADLDGRIDAVVEGGATDVGVESTILSLLSERPVLLRPGGLPRAALEEALGQALPEADSNDENPLAPGMLSSHYAPEAPVRLDVDEVRPGEALLAFGPALPQGADRACRVINLSPGGDLTEAASRLFAALRALDGTGARAIAVAPIPEDGLGEAIRDRLARAAAPRGAG